MEQDIIKFTVSEISTQLKQLIEKNFMNVWVEGEVSNVKYHTSGHIYFSLKDDTAAINAVIWSGQKGFLKFKLEDGQKITVFCKLSAYIARSQYQLIVLNAIPSGKGALQLAFEQLKKKLSLEGLFDETRKRPIPSLPQRIAVVTSPTGAAIRDILSVIRRRFANLEVLIYPVRVQGDEAKFEIKTAIEDLNSGFPEIEVIILARGGGSIEDLWAFNEEIVARAICASNIPVISAVGHEVDYTIADFVADKRAPTPSAAAEMVVNTKKEFIDRIAAFENRINSHISARMNMLKSRLEYLSKSRYFTDPFKFIEEKIQLIDDIAERLRLSLRHIVEITKFKLEKQIEKLELLSPLASLARGYSVVFTLPELKVVKSVNALTVGQDLQVKLRDGVIKVKTESIEKN